MIVVIFAVIIAILLILSRKKLGYFNLAIFTGIVTNRYWNDYITNFLINSRLAIPSNTLGGIIALVIVLLPAFMILAKNAKQENWVLGIFSSCCSAIFISTMSISNLEKVFMFDDLSRILSDILKNQASIIVLLIMIFSILSILSFKMNKIDKKS